MEGQAAAAGTHVGGLTFGSFLIDALFIFFFVVWFWILIRVLVDLVLRRLSPEFSRMYAKTGRPSIPPEHLLKATLLMALYSIRSERQFCERLQYDLLFKWFLRLNIADRAFNATTVPASPRRSPEVEA